MMWVNARQIMVLLIVYMFMAFMIPQIAPEQSTPNIMNDLEDQTPDQEPSAFEDVPILGALNGVKNFLVGSFQTFIIVAGLPVVLGGLEMPVLAKIPIIAFTFITQVIVIANTMPIIRAIGNIVPFT